MTGAVVSRTEIFMSDEEQKIFDNVINYVNNMEEEEFDALPEGVQHLLLEIGERCDELLGLIPEEH